MSDRVLTSSEAVSVSRPEPSKQWAWWSGSLLLVVMLTVATWWLNKTVPTWSKQLRVIEFPVYAVVLGLLAGGILSLRGVKERLAGYFRTEFFLKTGLVLLGATINLAEIIAFGARGLVQAVIMISSVFFFTWYLARWLGVEEKLRALLAASVAICGVSAAITAAGAVLARKEQLAYVTGLVILFALPLMFLQPLAALWLNLSPEVAGAWIGGNIDTTAAVVGAGTLHSPQALKVASMRPSSLSDSACRSAACARPAGGPSGCTRWPRHSIPRWPSAWRGLSSGKGSGGRANRRVPPENSPSWRWYGLTHGRRRVHPDE